MGSRTAAFTRLDRDWNMVICILSDLDLDMSGIYIALFESSWIVSCPVVYTE